jgi:integrase/recombinase XerD
MTAPLILKQVDWPDADRAVWAGLFVEGAILAGSGPCANWADGSRRKRAQAYGHWLGFLGQAGEMEGKTAPTERVTPATIGAFVGHEQARCKPITVYIHVIDLYVFCQVIDPGRDWSWLGRIAFQLHARCEMHALKPRASTNARAILDWALTRVTAVDSNDRITTLQRAYEYRLALMLGALIARPMRVRALMAIEVGKPLVVQQEGFTLRFRPEDMKDRKAREYVLPNALMAPMQRHLDSHRPTLLRGRQSPFLWITRPRQADDQEHLHQAARHRNPAGIWRDAASPRLQTHSGDVDRHRRPGACRHHRRRLGACLDANVRDALQPRPGR